MNKETTDLINALAEKLGTTAEHLWAVLIRQAPITASMELLLILTLLVAVIVTACLAWRCAKKNNDEAVACMTIISIALFVALIFTTATELPTIVAGFVNPEYWALTQVMGK